MANIQAEDKLAEHSSDQDFSIPEEDLQLWSALTLGSLQKQLSGTDEDDRFDRARELVDRLAENFSTSNPIDIADYFEAVQTISSIRESGNHSDVNPTLQEIHSAEALAEELR